MEILEEFSLREWTAPPPPEAVSRAAAALEGGKILYAPELRFALTESERRFLSPGYLDGSAKNISFRPSTGELGGTAAQGAEREELTAMVRRFYAEATALVRALCPAYVGKIVPGLTSFRPAEIAGRASSWRKDDTRLHVDAFPSRPSHGNRILRVFANVNDSAPRVWRAGEPFAQAARTLLPRVHAPFPGSLAALALFKVTKGKRTLYDHYMLGLHDAMKADLRYQSEAPQSRIEFPAGTSWACYTDLVSHGAISGQHVFEQTFYLPVAGMVDPALSPLRVLEGMLGKPLV